MIYVIRFFSYGVWGVVYPFLAVWLLGLRIFDEGAVGLVIGVSVIANRVGALAFVRVVERYDKRLMIIISQLVASGAAVGMHALSLGPTHSLGAWVAAGAVFGLASSVATLAQLAFIARQFPPQERKRAFSYENIALNIAGGVLPLLSAFVVVSVTGLYALVPVLFATMGIVLAIRLPRDARSGAADPEEAGAGEPRWPDATVLLGFNFLTLLVYAQFYGVYPVYAVAAMSEQEIGLVFAAGSVAIVALQAFITRLSARADDVRLIALANTAMAVGSLLLIFTAGGLPLAVLAVLGITIGEMIYGPLYQTLAVRVFRDRATLAMGAVTFVWGVSESLAILVGLTLVGAGLGHVSFLIGAGSGLLVAGLVIALRHRVARFGRVEVPSAG
ncbi:MAG TPA: MFS transporter [Actinophytocola sp.]|uniref:MFS transporter n=1 Tax=Actinophytocola sp. TaxID=1872138 RepID=UPI002DDD2860|nr:MFS transporter [Actinophytocola sp.]HEV2780523.1 MFS transporter [Actinophytocola sp.]